MYWVCCLQKKTRLSLITIPSSVQEYAKRTLVHFSTSLHINSHNVNRMRGDRRRRNVHSMHLRRLAGCVSRFPSSPMYSTTADMAEGTRTIAFTGGEAHSAGGTSFPSSSRGLTHSTYIQRWNRLTFSCLQSHL